MKRIVALIVCILLLTSLCAVTPVAAAEEIYYVVAEGQQVYLDYYRFDVSTVTLKTGRFLLPEGYTFKSTGVEGDKLRVTYCGMTDCYIANADVDKLVVSPSEVKLPDITVKTDDLFVYRCVLDEGTKEAKIEPHGAITDEAKLTYLGDYTYNSVPYYAVKIEGQDAVFYTLVSHSNSAEINAVLHPAANIVEPKSSQTDATDQKKDKEFTWVRFILILGIIVPFITIVLMIVRPTAGRRRVHREIYDDEDDYDGIDQQ